MKNFVSSFMLRSRPVRQYLYYAFGRYTLFYIDVDRFISLTWLAQSERTPPERLDNDLKREPILINLL